MILKSWFLFFKQPYAISFIPGKRQKKVRTKECTTAVGIHTSTSRLIKLSLSKPDSAAFNSAQATVGQQAPNY